MSARKETPLFYIGREQGKACFYYCGYDIGCVRVGYVDTFGEHMYWWYIIRIFTGRLLRSRDYSKKKY